MVKAEPDLVPAAAGPSAKLNHAVSVRNAFDKLQTSHTDEMRRRASNYKRSAAGTLINDMRRGQPCPL